ncbi:MAG TPA: hypothetical protein VG937_19725 [Polyangiaceae bacterium]|nr:hypothetical protein [Polyangiaceae bacterium]
MASLTFALANCGRTESDPGGDGGSDSFGGESSSGAMVGVGGSQSGAQGGTPAGATTGFGGVTSSGATSFGGASSGATSLGGAASSGATSRGGAPGNTGGSGSAGTPTIDPPHTTSQLDILFMVDNSISMADKQFLLSAAMPQFLARLVTPTCVDANGKDNGTKADAGGTCAIGTPEFEPVHDIHIGVVTSSLGGHGGQTCADSTSDDKAQLLSKVRAPDPSYPYDTWNESGFLAWDPDGTRNAPPGEKDLARFSKGLANMVASVGQTGCGYEASLEAWYRFLVAPDPIESVPQVTDPNSATMPVIPPAAQNQILLQRAAFLRPDSALVIVMLSDENDCSIVDSGQGWLVGAQNFGGGAFHMPRATSACEKSSNDPCCVSCAAAAPAGCPSTGSDPACAQPTLPAQDDNLNLRCFDQKRRFGFDLLYPLQRYVDGLTQTMIPNQSGSLVRNPLFPKGGRTPSMVFLGGIVGVPWQDLASKDSLAAGTPLKYLTHKELTDQGRWSLVLGSPDGTTLPGDKLMFETPKDRSTLFGAAPHPLVGAEAALAASSSSTRTNAINGHETNIADNSELQYACIFALPVIKDCTAGAAACECRMTDSAFNRAVCNGTSQTHARAFPGVRELRVLKAFGDLTGNAVPASICPKTLTDTASPSYGYSPAVNALVDALRPVLVP